MTPDNMVSVLKLRMLSSDDDTLDADIITLLNFVQDRLETEPQLPWFLFADDQTLVTVAATETVALPSDFIREWEEEEQCLFRYDSTKDDPWVGLTKENYSIIKNDKYGSGEPTHYDLLGTDIYLRKIPDDVYTLRLLYYKHDDDIAAGSTENLWLKYAYDWLMAETGLILTTDVVMMPRVAEHFREEAQRAQRRIKIETIAREEAGMLRQRGDK